jgi:hypothetical protein
VIRKVTAEDPIVTSITWNPEANQNTSICSMAGLCCNELADVKGIGMIVEPDFVAKP